MKLLGTESHLYLVKGNSVLKCSKTTKELSVCSLEGIAEDAINLGEFVAFIGKLILENECYLLVATECTPVAAYPGSNDAIYQINRITAVPVEKNGMLSKLDASPSKLEKIKNSQKKVMQFVTGKGSASRLIDEILRLFNDGGDFYICFKKDITLSIQSSFSRGQTNRWFFWNFALLVDLYDENGFPRPDTGDWIIPICQGFVAEREVSVDTETRLKLTLISRRSVNCAGVRYLKRGIDENGNVANFVETEVAITIFGHCLSFVQIRGSVPVFWIQQGYRYRPPLVISKPFNESYLAFSKHIAKLVETYDAPLTIVNLVEQRGRETELATSFLQHILHMNSPDVAYFTFDFHFRCRGLRFHKVADLISALSEQISKMGFCWIDKSGEMVRKQRGVIRTNCVDCLDRTNVVQCAVSQALCLIQVQKLGIVGPQSDAPIELIQALQTMWADNGDAISRQYAGTNALKGDVTRSGQRNLAGLVKDGYNSASRYYLSHMRDAQRQLAIDAFLGKSTKMVESQSEQFEGEEEEETESIGRLVHEAALFILHEKEILVGGWALVEASSGTDQIDTVVLLTKTELIVASYDDDTKLSDVKRISFDKIGSLECGRLSRSSRTHLRVYSKSGEQFTWRAAKTRLFNNVAIPLKSEDEADEYVQAIGEQVKVTMALAGKIINLSQVALLKTSGRIDRNRKRLMNAVASVFRPHTDDRLRPRVPSDEHVVFSKLDRNDDDAVILSPERNICAVDDITLNANAASRFDCDVVAKKHGNIEVNGSLGTNKGEDCMQQKKDLFEVSRMCPSKSDSYLAEKADDFMSLLQKLRLTTSRSNYSTTGTSPDMPAAQNPFSQYRQQILDSKSRIILL